MPETCLTEEPFDVRLGSAEALRSRDGWLVVRSGSAVVGVYCADGVVHAYENRCPHQGGPVCLGQMFPQVVASVTDDGNVVDTFRPDRPRIVCPWHGWEFELPSGRAAADPRWRLNRLDVFERDGDLYASAPGRLGRLALVEG